MLDLTQFDGITRGEWKIKYVGERGFTIVAPYNNDGVREVVIANRGPWHNHENDACAIAAIPAMIAEIRRLREERDRYHTALANIVRHMEIVVGGNMPSTVATIASNALSRKEAP